MKMDKKEYLVKVFTKLITKQPSLKWVLIMIQNDRFEQQNIEFLYEKINYFFKVENNINKNNLFENNNWKNIDIEINL